MTKKGKGMKLPTQRKGRLPPPASAPPSPMSIQTACRRAGISSWRDTVSFAVTKVEMNPLLWDLYADLSDVGGDPDKALECKEKMFRALNRGQWEEHEEAARESWLKLRASCVNDTCVQVARRT